MKENVPSVVPPSEVALVREVARGEEAAVEALYESYAEAVLRFVYRRVGEHYEDAEEITQDVFLSAVNLAGTYQGSGSVWRWLCGLAKMRIVDFYRRQKRGKRIPPEKMVPLDEETLQALHEYEQGMFSEEELVARLEVADWADRMLGVLTDDEREVLLLHYVEEFSVREIAPLMQRTEKGVEGLLTRARKKAAAAGWEWA